MNTFVPPINISMTELRRRAKRINCKLTTRTIQKPAANHYVMTWDIVPIGDISEEYHEARYKLMKDIKV